MTVMQDSFTRAILAPDRPVPVGLIDPAGRAAGRRFDVYRNNVVVGLTEALVTAFPVLHKLLGDGSFRSLARLYVRAHPPRTPLMMFFGEDLPGFLEAFEPLSHLGYLADVARLELALRRSYHAADGDPLTPEALSRTPPGSLAGARLRLAPALQLLRSAWPVHAIWRFNTDPDAPKPVMRAEDVLVCRPAFDPEPVLLPPGAAAFVAALAAGRTLSDAAEAAAAAAPDFDLAGALGILLRHGALTDLELPE